MVKTLRVASLSRGNGLLSGGVDVGVRCIEMDYHDVKGVL